ncbi:MAG TPA: hypothetical protein VFU63_01565 [Ktedonobacterales bacterium]|nr:hypothetical protein [Ktedonobacterales bacterium]
MDQHGWRGQGSPSQPDTGIAQVLSYYTRYGGELLGARRSDNPLTLTHVRWHDQAGHVFDASHSPDMDGDIDAAEREVWVQLALDLPIAAAGMYGPRAPWERLALNQERAAELLNQLRRSQSSRISGNSNNPARWSPGHSAPPLSPSQGYAPNRPGFSTGWNANQPASPGPYSPPQQPAYQQPIAQQSPASNQQPFPPHSGQSAQSGPIPGAPYAPSFAPRSPGEPPMSGAAGPSADAGREWTNAMRTTQDPEVTVIPCIEVELPPVLTDPAASDQARDFTRDVARHFNRSARQLPQARETRGWMRNGRMVLAARIAIAPGSRVPSHTEMDNAARLLADALARNMLPYTRMTFAEPGEWTQGIALPE